MASTTREQIDSVEGVKALTVAQLRELASDIRQEIIDVVSHNGGHLATNLGSVELTIALHHVFDSPTDKLIWDVGNQCYAHKIITGRRGRFPTIRTRGGLSGFVNRRESSHDVVTAGHSGTALSTALGLAAARDRQGDDYLIVAIVGDGALTGGLSYEALNNIEGLRSQLLVVINDNAYSISPTRGGVSAALGRCKARILDGGIFKELGLTYLGPVDGHDIDLLVKVLGEAKEISTPVLLHAVTIKGKGYRPAERDPGRFHGAPPFDVATGQTIHRSPAPTYSELFGQEMVEIAEADAAVVAITAAMTIGTGLTEFARRFPDRFVDVGIAEQHAVTFGGGLALGGARPVIAIYSSFLQRAYDSLIHDVCLQDLPVTLVLDRAGLVGDDGPTHHGVFDLAYLRTMPGMIVAAPKDGEEFRQMLRWAVGHPAPTAIRVPRGPVPEPILPTHKPLPIEPGRAELLRDGSDVALLAIGSMVAPAVQAADVLKAKGVSCAVVNARFVKPLDEGLLPDIASRVRHVFTLEEHVRHGGFGSAVLELLSRRSVTTPVTMLALPDTFIEHGDGDTLRDEAGLSTPGIVESVITALAPASQKQDEADLPDPAVVRAEMAAIAQRPLSPELTGWVERYSSVGRRDPFLWNWCLKGVELTCLPCVDPQLRDQNNETKVMGVMFDVLLDDVADHAKDMTFLERLLAIPSGGARLGLDSLAPEQRRYAEFANAVWQAIINRAQRYPRYAEFRELLSFDYLQLLNAMRYATLINLAPHAINLAEHDLYLPHNMHMMVSGTLDLMCSPTFDRDELGKTRRLLWNAQCMGRVGNLITTWERELFERDFSSGVFAHAVEKAYVTPDELRNGDPEELKRRICQHGGEAFFLARWHQCRQQIRSMVGEIRSFDVAAFLGGLEQLLRIHLGSRGLK